MKKYMVITEIHNEDGSIERWFYGTWEDRNKANDVAYQLNEERGSRYPVCSTIIPTEEAEEWGVQNLPTEN